MEKGTATERCIILYTINVFWIFYILYRTVFEVGILTPLFIAWRRSNKSHCLAHFWTTLLHLDTLFTEKQVEHRKISLGWKFLKVSPLWDDLIYLKLLFLFSEFFRYVKMYTFLRSFQKHLISFILLMLFYNVFRNKYFLKAKDKV